MSDEREPDSVYQKLVPPELHSSIPTFMFGLDPKMSDGMKHILTSLDVVQKQNEWIIAAVVDCNRAIRELDIHSRQSRAELETRLETAEQWQRMVTSKWAVVVAILIMFAPLVAKTVYDSVFQSVGHKP